MADFGNHLYHIMAKMWQTKNLLLLCTAAMIINCVNGNERNFSEALDVHSMQNLTQETKNLKNQTTANEFVSASQDLTQMESCKVHAICDICSCPKNEVQQPYIINCKALILKCIPNWSEKLSAEPTTLNNVHLEFDYNDIEIITLINECKIIDGISFGNNKIYGIEPFAFAELPNLKRLSLRNNQIELIHPSAFKTSDGQSSAMELLDMSNNNIHHLDRDIFENLVNLLELNLGGNPFGILDCSTVSCINSLPNLQYLNMASTGLDDLPQPLEDTVQHLQHLDIAQNNFMKVPAVIQHGRHLLELIMSDNPLIELQASSFIELQSLQRLHICHMPSLKTIYKGTFYPLTSLLTLKCNNNPSLAIIEAGAFWNKNGEGPVNLDTLELKENNLTTLDEELLSNMAIHHLDLRNNPLNCSCQLAWLKFEKAAQDYLDETICWYPVEVNGKSLAEIEITCSEKETSAVIVLKKSRTSYVTVILVLFMALALLLSLTVMVTFLIKFCRKDNSIQYNKLTISS